MLRLLAPDSPLLERRRLLCAGCPFLQRLKIVPDRCRVCGCFVAAKTKLVGEHCPKGKW